MMEVIGVNLDDTLEKVKFERLVSYTSIETRKRIGRFHVYEDALRTLTGDILIRYLICKRLGIDNKELLFGVNEYGKPFLINQSEVEFNISHSGKWVACSVDNLPVGIDIEQIRPIDMGIANRFFSKDEITDVMEKNPVEREAYFYDLWVLKESYIKAVGKGLSLPLDSFTIKFTADNITVHESDNYYFKQYHIDEHYRMAVCSRKNKFPDRVNLMDINKLHEEILLL